LLAAFEQVNENFSKLFTHLSAVARRGLSSWKATIRWRPVSRSSASRRARSCRPCRCLSGGEQTLTALALIFAVFLANPAPICVLDEVDAPLDDANVGRFCDLLDEMTRRTETRFLIITHHAVTMARMDRLFGVTMAEQGVSQLVSVDLKKAEAMVA
jgi:chromosome segregation protein